MNNEKPDPRSADYMKREEEAGRKERELRRFFDGLTPRARKAIRKAQARAEGRREGLAAMMGRLGQGPAVVAILGLLVALSVGACTWDPNGRKALLRRDRELCKEWRGVWSEQTKMCILQVEVHKDLVKPKEPATQRKRR
jgi:hypothetical protein